MKTTISFNIHDFLSKVDPFKGLPNHEMNRLEKTARVVGHPKGEVIFSEGEEATSVWVLVKGRLDIYKYTSDAKPRVIETIMPKELYGTLCRIGGTGKSYPCTAVAAEESTSLQIPDVIFLDQFKKYPSMVSGVCTLCSQRLSQMQDLSCMSQEPVERRIAKILINLSFKHGNTIPLTKREIAEMAATTVETTIRTMSQFQKKNWITSSRGKITLQEPDKIKSLSQ